MFSFLDSCWEGTELSHSVRGSDNHRASRHEEVCVQFSTFNMISIIKNLPRPYTALSSDRALRYSENLDIISSGAQTS